MDEGTIQKYKADLADEIEPCINELMERAEQGLKTLYKKEGLLQAKVHPDEILLKCDANVCIFQRLRRPDHVQ